MLKYKINILEELANAGYNTSRLRKEKLFTESTIQRFRHGGVLSLKSLDRLCCLLKMQPGDIIEYVDDKINYNI